jgi:hypothetical protein
MAKEEAITICTVHNKYKKKEKTDAFVSYINFEIPMFKPILFEKNDLHTRQIVYSEKE